MAEEREKRWRVLFCDVCEQPRDRCEDAGCGEGELTEIEVIPADILDAYKEMLDRHIDGERELREAAQRDNDTEGVLIHGTALSALADFRAALSKARNLDTGTEQGGKHG